MCQWYNASHLSLREVGGERMKAARVIFYIEVLMNLYAAQSLFFDPASYVGLFYSGADPLPGPALEMNRWYGVLVFAIVYLELRALLSRNNAVLAVAQEALLLSDVLQLIACYRMSQATGGWLRMTMFTAGLAIFLAAVRILWLYAWRQQRQQMLAAPTA